ncbi:hypothetical protein AX16_004230 [Volvariella volvacea WC 439]|nr:hypothetical protein AX16_004230 [Volvariella volvacea WC 439]
MDNAGWHAFRRAHHDQEYIARNAYHGADGYWQSSGQVQPVPQPYYGGFPMPGPPPGAGYPPPGYPHSSYPGAPPAPYPYDPAAMAPPVPQPDWTQFSAAERSQKLRIARMEPPLQFMCGPLLRYDTVDHSGIWRGAALIVTADAGSTYEPAPRLFLEWDPDAPPKLTRPTPNGAPTDLPVHPADQHTAYNLSPSASLDNRAVPKGPRAQSRVVNGEELWVYQSYSGIFTFWRFLIEVPLADREMAVQYSINNGQQLEFFVPGRRQNLRWAAHSCNGFSAGVNPDDFRGPGFRSGYDPLWVDLLNKHAEKPFHVMVGGGDQIYCDSLMREAEMQDWVTRKPEEKQRYQLNPTIMAAMDKFYFNHYCQHFRSGAFARANSTIPMINMADDHDLIDGFGSYPDELQTAPIFQHVGRRGYFFFLLFQCFINPDKDGYDDTRHFCRSLVIGGKGPYIGYPSHSFLSYMGPNVGILLLDCRAERKKEQVCSELEYRKVFDRLKIYPQVQHLIVQLGIPIAYPRMVFLETALESKFNPLVALGRSGSLGLSGFVNKFNADAELLDDLNDHWTAKSHKSERNNFIGRLQHLALAKGVRITFLSGDVHCAAVGVLKTLKGGDPASDHRYMLNVVTSAIVNTPPPIGVLTMVNSLATKTHKTLHNMQTDEAMLGLFEKDPDGSPRKMKFIIGRRNWCQVDFDPRTYELIFDIRIERDKGLGDSVGYAARSPPPRWQPQPRALDSLQFMA